MKRIALAIILFSLCGCHSYTFYSQGESIPHNPGWNYHETTWNINGTPVGKYDPPGNVVGEPVGWNCKYSATTNSTSGYTAKWLTCRSLDTVLTFALTCKLEENDYKQYQIRLRGNNFMIFTCETADVT